MLRRLSGREHQVITGIALVDAATGWRRQSAVASMVLFRTLRDDEIAAYVATGEPRDKAGAYAIQGIGGGLIEGFAGCYTNIVGLPLCEVSKPARRKLELSCPPLVPVAACRTALPARAEFDSLPRRRPESRFGATAWGRHFFIESANEQMTIPAGHLEVAQK